MASLKEIKTAFRRLAKRHHPDHSPNDPEAERTFKAVAEAYAVLGRPQRRAQYDDWRADKRRRPAQPPPSYTEAAHAFVEAFSAASLRAQTVFFDALLPRYLEAYGTGPGYQLVYHLLNDLDSLTFMSMNKRPKPSFGTRGRIHHILQECPTRTDSGAKVGPMGGLVLGQLTAVVLRGAKFHQVTVYAGSFFASGQRDIDTLSVAIVKLLIREYARYFERNLAEGLQPLHQRDLDPNAPIPYTIRQAKWRDISQSIGWLVKWATLGSLGALIVHLLWERLFP